MYTHRPSHNRTAVNAVNANATSDPNTSEPADTSVNAVGHPKPAAKETVSTRRTTSSSLRALGPVPERNKKIGKTRRKNFLNS